MRKDKSKTNKTTHFKASLTFQFMAARLGVHFRPMQPVDTSMRGGWGVGSKELGVLSWGKKADSLGSHVFCRDGHLSREQALQSWVKSSAQGDPELVLVALHSPLHSAAPETSVPIRVLCIPKAHFHKCPLSYLLTQRQASLGMEVPVSVTCVDPGFRKIWRERMNERPKHCANS